MEWKHMCDLDWLQARQDYLTATDIKELLPVTKTGRTRKVTEENYWKVWSSKIRILTQADCISTGAAARGHLLEPYAIKAYNDIALINEWVIFKHWDDLLITSARAEGSLAFSPDAMADFVYSPGATVWESPELPLNTVIGEVKSYGAERHLVAINTPNDELEERWQLATAMACNENIDTAKLIFFNPGLKESNLGIKCYTRNDLEDEISIVEGVAEKWIAFIDSMVSPGRMIEMTEQDIIKELEAKQRLNPI